MMSIEGVIQLYYQPVVNLEKQHVLADNFSMQNKNHYDMLKFVRRVSSFLIILSMCSSTALTIAVHTTMFCFCTKSVQKIAT